MARIVYGLSGEGSGHAMRSRVVLRHLVEAGHTVKVATFDRGVAALAKEFDVTEVEGLSIVARANHVSLLRTLAENVRKLPKGARSARKLKHELFDAFQPELVICDFEPLTAHLALREQVPLVSLDNQHFQRYVEHESVPGRSTEARTTLAIIRAIVPRSRRSIVTSFLPGKPSNARTVVVPPILRPEVLAARATRGEHVLVYVTQVFEGLLEDLRSLPRVPFRLYGFERSGRAGSLEFKQPSAGAFLEDLASARAVIATAGFSLLGEALQLRKPLLTLPMGGQYEQELNSYLLGRSGWGKDGRDATRETIGDFLFRLPDYEAALEKYPRGDANRKALAAVDAAVREFAR
ncbi:MAG: hypothetical protein IPJ19_21170 [Planctomycetes bacterium]|nr:hypothetical protein [Planctomycetota bacterium]